MKKREKQKTTKKTEKENSSCLGLLFPSFILNNTLLFGWLHFHEITFATKKKQKHENNATHLSSSPILIFIRLGRWLVHLRRLKPLLKTK
jgi:hypothetical protein